MLRPVLAAFVCGSVLASGAESKPEKPQAAGVVDLSTRSGSDWPGFLGPRGDGSSPGNLPSPPWPAAGPPIVWHTPVGDGYSMPAIDRGRLFLFDRRGDRAGVSCLHSETGEPLWRVEYPTDYEDLYGFSNGPRTTPVVDGERVCTFGVEGRLRCHSVVDGSLLWEVDTAARFGVVQNFFGVGSSPMIEGDLLIVQVGGSPPGSPGIHSGKVRGNGSGIVAFDKRTGEVRYRITDELAGYGTPVFTTVGERRWGFVLARGGLVGFEPATGKVDFDYPWRSRKLESVNAANPVVVGNTVFISESYGPGSALLRFRAGGSDVVWKEEPRGSRGLRAHWATPVHHDGYLYGSSGSSSGDADLRAVELSTGEVRWREPGLGRSTLLRIGGRLIVLTEFGKLIAVEATPKRYRRLAEVDLASRKSGDPEARVEPPAWNAPALARGLLYVRGKNRLLCLELIPGERGASRPATAAP